MSLVSIPYHRKKKEAAEKPAGTYIVTADNMASVFDFEIEEREGEMTY